MPSPVAHILFGLTSLHLLRAGLPGPGPKTWALLGMVLLASLAPDLDFFPGLILGDPSRYHQSLSHSLGAAFLIALVLGGAARLRFPEAAWWQWSGLALLVIFGHLFLDYFTADTRPPIGFPLFWPFSERRFTYSLPIFPPLLRDPALPDFWSHNLFTMMVELLILIPPWVVSRTLDPGRAK
ncbi:MAG: metal-dependent hydrolase [Deltaproteobacteria bacterium]|nr:metal-dependent hydrolase [Deltaproteobacteria bacterium]